jgi:hypothetical protein
MIISSNLSHNLEDLVHRKDCTPDTPVEASVQIGIEREANRPATPRYVQDPD